MHGYRALKSICMRLEHVSVAELALLSTPSLRNIPLVANGNPAMRQEGISTMMKLARDFAALCVMMAVTAAVVSFQYVPYL